MLRTLWYEMLKPTSQPGQTALRVNLACDLGLVVPCPAGSGF